MQNEKLFFWLTVAIIAGIAFATGYDAGGQAATNHCIELIKETFGK